jgi:nucleotide-binding universal stress UspA family protein
VALAQRVLAADAEVTLLHVAPGDAEALAAGGPAGLLGRRPPPPAGPPLRAISEAAAQALLDDAERALGRPARRASLRGRVEHEVVAAATGMDVLVLARDGARGQTGPRSLGHAARFVVDHAPCAVLLGEPQA